MAATPESLSERLDTLYSTTWQLMRDEAVDNIFNATPLWYWLSSRGRIRKEAGGRWIGIPLLYAKNTTVASLGPGGTIDISNTDPLTTAKYDWKYVAGSVMRLHADDTQNSGKEAIMSLMQSKLKTLELSLIDALESQTFGDGSGNGGLDILGLQSIIQTDPTSAVTSPPGNIGGIDGVTNTWWENQTRSWSTSGLLTGDSDIGFNFRILYNKCSVGNDHPTLILTDVTSYEHYEASLTAILKPVDTEMNDVGFEALRYKGCAITFSPSAPAGNAYFLNERYLEFVANSNAYFEMTDWKAIPNQLDRVAQVLVMGNLVCSNRRMHGVLTGITS